MPKNEEFRDALDDALKASGPALAADVIKPGDTLAAMDGAAVTVYDPDGVVLFTLPLSRGLHKAASILKLLPPGALIEGNSYMDVIPAPSGYHVQPYGEGHTETACKGTYRPTSADHNARQIAQLTRIVQQQGQHMQRMERASAALSQQQARMTQAPSPEEAELIEAEGAPKPAPEASAAE